MKKRRFRYFFNISVCLFLLPNISRANHVIGGEMTYRFISQNPTTRANTYRFRLKLYIDCVPNPANGIAFDAPSVVNITVYQGANTAQYLVNGQRTIDVALQRSTLVALPSYRCLIPPADVCAVEGIYDWDLTLPESTQPFTVSYGTCCRNTTINNIRFAYATGAMFTTQITPFAFSSRNSSPVFTNFPPTVICLGEPFVFNHAATDADGDRLTYELVAPLDRPSSGISDPSVPGPPPYIPVTYVAPYTGLNPMNANPALQIDPNTGIITGTPTVAGQFVVGIRVNEYRNGVLIGSTSRDFQFNVKRCPSTLLLDIVADSVSGKTYFVHSCETKTVQFRNNTVNNSPNPTYNWAFRAANNNTVQRFTTASPTVTFPDTGYYIGKLYINEATLCGDSCEVRINVGSGMVPKFNLSFDTCTNTPVVINNRTQRGYAPIRRWLWNFGDGTQLDTTAPNNPSHLYQSIGTKTVRLTVTDRFGCQRDTAQTFTRLPAPTLDVVQPKGVYCAPSSVVFLNRSLPTDSTYRTFWDFGDSTTSSVFSPTHTYQKAGNYNVRVTMSSPLNCVTTQYFNKWIPVGNVPTADFDWDETNLTNLNANNIVHFRDRSSLDVRTWRWDFDSVRYSTTRNPVFNFGRDTGVRNIVLAIQNQYGCRDTMRKSLYIKPVVTFFMPTAFTPNFDGTNDEFRGKGFTYGLRNFSLTVWNRWGEILFSSNTPDEGWSGRKNNVGEPLPEGTYLYRVSYTTPTGEQVEKRDFLTLFR